VRRAFVDIVASAPGQKHRQPQRRLPASNKAASGLKLSCITQPHRADRVAGSQGRRRKLRTRLSLAARLRHLLHLIQAPCSNSSALQLDHQRHGHDYDFGIIYWLSLIRRGHLSNSLQMPSPDLKSAFSPYTDSPSSPAPYSVASFNRVMQR
jgi:hypothetical protein